MFWFGDDGNDDRSVKKDCDVWSGDLGIPGEILKLDVEVETCWMSVAVSQTVSTTHVKSSCFILLRTSIETFVGSCMTCEINDI